MDFLARLLDTSDFPPRWMCGSWSDGHGWLHILSDIGVFSAYFAIPLVLAYFLARRRDLPFRRIFVLFAAFILLCGTTHLMEAIIFWWPAYRLAGMLKLITAVVSWVTVLALFRVVPGVLTMRTPEELEREITARRQAEEALLRSNAELELRVQERTTDLTKVVAALRDERELLRTTLASIGDGVIVTDHDEKVTFLNGVAESLTGWTTAEANSAPLAEVFKIVNEHSRLPVQSPAQRALAEGVVVGLANHTVLIAKDGSECPIEDSAAPIRSKPGQVVGCVLVFRDVTDRRREELERARSEQRLRFVMDSMPQKIFTARPNGDLDYLNPFWTEFTGLPFEEICDWGWKQFIHPEDLEENVRVWKRSVDTGEPFQFEHRFRRADGEYRWHISRARAMKDADGKVQMWVGSNTEIHEQKQISNELKQLTAELSQADGHKNEFLAMLAHELRNPLAPIRNALQIVQLSRGNGEAVLTASEMMERQIAQMVRLVDDLLDVSRITRGKIDLRLERTDLASIIAQAVETCRPAIDSARHELKVDLPDEPVYLNADPIRLAQAFGNLLNNATKYTDPEGRISVIARRDGNDVIVSVRDNGIGIPPEMLPKVFEMFTQVDRSLERTQGGLGIGLTLVQRLVQLHGGSVSAFSEGKGQGSEFTVRLPILPQEARQATKPAQSDLGSAQSRRILVVDDNRDSASSLAMLLTISGHKSHTAFDGQEAVEAAETIKPDVILMDIGLPKLNGYEAAKKIRETSWGKKMVLVALTGWGQEEDRRKSKEAGFDAHLVKPVDFGTLTQLLGDLPPPG